MLLLFALLGIWLPHVRAELTSGDNGKSIIIQNLTESGGLYSTEVELQFKRFFSDQQRVVRAEMLIDTSRRGHWLAKRGLNESETKELLAGSSRTFEAASRTFGNGLSISGVKTIARINFAGILWDTDHIKVAKDVETIKGWKSSSFDGTLSLASLLGRAAYINSQSALDYTTGVNRTTCSLYLKASAKDANSAGALVIGGTDRRFYTGNITYIYYNSHEMLRDKPTGQVDVQSIRIQRPELQVDGNSIFNAQFHFNHPKRRVNFDSTSVFSVGDKSVIENFLRQHIEMRDIFDGFYALSCQLDDLPNIVFNLGDAQNSFELVLEPKDYVLDISLTDSSEENNCIFAIRGRETNVRDSDWRSNPLSWSFGTSVMKKYYMVFEYANKRLGFATAS